MGMLSTASLPNVMTNIGFFIKAIYLSLDQYLYFFIGLIVAMYLARRIIMVINFAQKQRSDYFNTLREENIKASIQIENDEALKFNKKYGDKVVSQDILEKELLNR